MTAFMTSFNRRVQHVHHTFYLAREQQTHEIPLPSASNYTLRRIVLQQPTTPRRMVLQQPTTPRRMVPQRTNSTTTNSTTNSTTTRDLVASWWPHGMGSFYRSCLSSCCLKHQEPLEAAQVQASISLLACIQSSLLPLLRPHSSLLPLPQPLLERGRLTRFLFRHGLPAGMHHVILGYATRPSVSRRCHTPNPITLNYSP